MSFLYTGVTAVVEKSDGEEKYGGSWLARPTPIPLLPCSAGYSSLVAWVDILIFYFIFFRY